MRSECVVGVDERTVEVFSQEDGEAKLFCFLEKPKKWWFGLSWKDTLVFFFLIVWQLAELKIVENL